MTEEQVFLAALDLPNPTHRSAYLDKACGSDTALRQQVEELLAAHFKSGEFLNEPVVHQLGTSPAAATIAETMYVAEKHAMSNEQQTDEESDDLHLQPSQRADSLGRIGHYEVLQVLGKGGFGIVFRAFDDVLQRVVALKVLAPAIAATSPARRRFLREARASARVRHENVVQVHAVEESPVPYLVMEFIAGETLQQRLDRKGPLEAAEIVSLGRQIAEGLAAAHATGLIHRDIKPGNVLVEGERVKITDFGLARAADDASMTQSGVVAGTPMYMAPEQAQGETLDQRADLFSLGSVLYVMASGRPPFRAATTFAVLKRVVEEDPRSIRDVIPETPQWLCDIIAKLHAKQPDDRYQTAREVADVLANCDAQLKEHSRLNDLSLIPRRRAQPAGRWKWIAAAAVFLPLIALIVTEFAGVTHLLQKPQPTVAIAPTVHADTDPPTPIATANFALEFDGQKSMVRIPSLKINEDGPLTVETWAVLDQPADQPKQQDLVGNPNTSGFALSVPGNYGGNGKKLGFLMRVKEPDTYVSAWEKQPLPRHQLIHLAGVYDGKAEIRLFVNGRLQSRTPAVQGVQPSIAMVVLGANWSGTSNFRGRMNEVRISKVARYESDFTPAQRWASDTDTLALYHFDEGDGAVLKDSSGNGHHGEIVRAKWVPMSETRDNQAPPLALAPFDAVQAKGHQEAWAKHLGVPVEFENSIGMKLRLIPPGEFTMGSSPEEIEYAIKLAPGWAKKSVESEGPARRARVVRPFALAVHEVTVGQFRRFVDAAGYVTDCEKDGQGGWKYSSEEKKAVQRKEYVWHNPAFSASDDHPVVHVTLEDAQAFCAWLSQTEGRRYVLPSETQWEFACRAGTQTAWYWGEVNTQGLDLCWSRENSDLKAHKVGGKLANPFGLHDMAGNVCEIALDDQDQLTSRGGTFFEPWVLNRSAWRHPKDLHVANHHRGFRVALLGDLKPAALPPTFKNNLGMEFVKVPKGKSWLGGGKDKLGDTEVEIPADFYLGKYEVTQEEWERVMGNNPSQFTRMGSGKETVKDIQSADLKRFPVEMVNWDQCQAFVAKLNQQEPMTGWVYRLPTLQEWEYACRGGTMADQRESAFDFYFAQPTNTLSREQANVGLDAELKRSCKVGSYEPNRLGLYDMHGNVWEWCHDEMPNPIQDRTRAHRGGSYRDADTEPSQAGRFYPIPPTRLASNVGLRLARVPSGAPSPEAKTPAIAVAPFDAAQAKQHQEAWAKHLGVPVEFENSVGMMFRLIPPGEFTMGTADGDPRTDDWDTVDEGRPASRPQHLVRISRPYYGGIHEVTVEQFRAFVQATGYVPDAERSGHGSWYWDEATAKIERKAGLTWSAPGYKVGANFPVTAVTFRDAAQFCAWVSKKEGRTYRLPTEAEWEYACRAGTTTAYAFGPELMAQQAVFGRRPSAGPATVGSCLANAYGLCDMHGNVPEWCADGPREYTTAAATDPVGPDREMRVYRGGSYAEYVGAHLGLQSSGRRASDPGQPDVGRGFRVVVVGDLRKAVAAAPERQTAPPPVAPFTDADVKRIAALPAPEQVEEVRKELVKRNPGFDGKVEHKIEDGVVITLEFCTDDITDISPVKGLKGLRLLQCASSAVGTGQLVDLSPLRDLPIAELRLWFNKVIDLSPLGDCPLRILDITGNPVTDLAPVKTLKIEWLNVRGTPLTDLTLLKDLPLKELHIDLQPQQDVEILRSIKTLEKINGKPAAEFWKEVDEK